MKPEPICLVYDAASTYEKPKANYFLKTIGVKQNLALKVIVEPTLINNRMYCLFGDCHIHARRQTAYNLGSETELLAKTYKLDNAKINPNTSKICCRFYILIHNRRASCLGALMLNQYLNDFV